MRRASPRGPSARAESSRLASGATPHDPVATDRSASEIPTADIATSEGAASGVASSDADASERDSSDLAIRLRGLGRRYGRSFALRGIDLDVGRGRSVLVAGSNGAGKTTLLKVIATRLRPSEGVGSVFGHDLLAEASAVRRRVAWLGVSGGAYAALDARENLRFAGALYGLPRDELDDRVQAALVRVGLAATRGKPLRAFSSGMTKRLGLARLLLADADLWLLDEPFAALDAEGRDWVDALLVEARAEGRTVLLASHETDRAERLTDATLHVRDGTVVVVRR